MTPSSTIHQQNENEQYTNTTDPHTSIPDWLIFSSVSHSAFRTACAMLSNKVLPVTQAELAERLQVDVRSIQRWQDELKAAGMLTSYQAGRRWLNVIHKPTAKHDRAVVPNDVMPIERSTIERSTIERSTIELSCQTIDTAEHLPAHSLAKQAIHDRAIDDRIHGGGGDTDHDKRHDPPTPHSEPTQNRTKVLPKDIKTATGIHMVQVWGFSLVKAAALQHLQLEACKADYARRKLAGQKQGAIIQAWEVAPPLEHNEDNQQAGRLNYTEIKQLYGDLFAGDHPAEHIERGDPVVDDFLKGSGL
jgi:hypothetical protein